MNELSEGTSQPPRERLQVQLLRWAVGIGLGVGLLVLLNQLQIPYYLYYPRTTHTVLISDASDFYLFLVSTLTVPTTLGLYAKKLSKSVIVGVAAVWITSLILTLLGQVFALPVLYATVIGAAALCSLQGNSRRAIIAQIAPSALTVLILIECPALFYWMGAALNPHGGVGFLSEQIEANLTYSLYPLAPAILILALFSWIRIPLIGHLSRPKSHLLVRYQPSTSKLNPRSIAASLDLIAIISVVLFFYSYLAGQTWVVGVDSHLRYLDPLNGLSGLTLSQALSTSYTHGAYLVVLYLLQLGTGVSAFSLVKYAPLILTFAVGSTVFFVAHSGGWNLELGLLSAISTLLWLPTTLGIYAGIQANWIALILWMLFLSLFFLKRTSNLLNYVILGLLSLAILLVHPWTWGVFVTTLAFTAIIMRRTSWRRDCVQGLMAALIISVPVGFGAYELIPGLGGDFASTVQLYSQTALNPIGLLSFGGALLELFSNWGSFLSPVLLLVSLLGAATLYRRQGIIANYLVAWTLTWCIGSILIAPWGYNPVNAGISETGLWRMLYVSPLPFLLALGLQRFLQLAKHTRAELRGGLPQGVLPRLLPIFSIVPYLLLSAGLFASWVLTYRILLVAGGLILSFLLVRLLRYRGFETLLWFIMALFLLNAAFRSLFPLLLDPHNLFSTVGSGTGTR